MKTMTYIGCVVAGVVAVVNFVLFAGSGDVDHLNAFALFGILSGALVVIAAGK